ncbi:hypothetical protein NMK34_27305 [Micromonospora sp. BRA006-A]|uniref:hypothetical protein n=1 Tax=Micromonospora sp. BRA006-A TaxID=2962860 RepID=UPI00296E4B72|nr:hypothetical protein [Micromonospora sp. BRA006-A]MDW3850327.1 hypothetical protein [Micromonospora sp. BRA006-A]
MAWEWVSPLLTAAVGVAGIAGGAWTASEGRKSQAELLHRQADGEARREIRAEKRALYARALGELMAFAEASVRHRNFEEKGFTLEDGFTEADEAFEKRKAQLLTVGLVAAEVAVVAGLEVAQAVYDVIDEICSISASRPLPERVFSKVIAAMHKDLSSDSIPCARCAS